MSQSDIRLNRRGDIDVERSSLSAVLRAEAPVSRCGAQAPGQARGVTCRLSAGHKGRHEAWGRRWLSPPTPSDAELREADEREGFR
jgi:hypothetical protein